MQDNSTLEKLYQISLKFATLLHLQETYKFIVHEAMKLTSANVGSILLLQEDKLKRVYASTPELYKIKPQKRDFTYRALKTQKVIFLNKKKNPNLHRIFRETNFSSGAIVPLLNQDQPMGVLTLLSLNDLSFTEEQMSMIKLFTPLAVNAIRKAELYDETQKALESRDLFISMAAHELRTPLTTINGYAQLLYSKLSKANTPESRWVEDLTLESYRMTQLINELLEINRIKTGQLRYIWVECSLLDLINRALRDFRFTHPANKIVIKNKLPENKDNIIGDYNKILQVIINLLDNAAKFSPLNKKITISMRRIRGFIVLEITDRGKGIPSRERPKVYDMFYRGENTGEGMGVGLFLAKNIITHHRGDIYIKSTKNRGTKVTIKLPEIKK